jgi:hypothetical protein
LPILGEDEDVIVGPAGKVDVARRDMTLDDSLRLAMDLVAHALPVLPQALADLGEADKVERAGGDDVAALHGGGETCFQAARHLCGYGGRRRLSRPCWFRVPGGIHQSGR